MLVVVADVFASETLNDNHHHVLCLKVEAVGWLHVVNGVEHGCHRGFVLEKVGHLEVILADGTDQGEGRVEHYARFGGRVAIVVGIRYGDWTDIARPATSHACHAERGEAQQ